jgi:hypothetical protein
VVGGLAFIEGVYCWRSEMMVKECIKIDPTKHIEELLAALPSLRQMKSPKSDGLTVSTGGSKSASAGAV